MNESEREGEFKHNVRMFNENVAMCIHFANLMEDYASGSDIKLSKKVLEHMIEARNLLRKRSEK
jgi:hypothetical protein